MVRLKRAFVILLMLILLPMIACRKRTEQHTADGQGIQSSLGTKPVEIEIEIEQPVVVEYDTLDEAKAAVDFDFSVPSGVVGIVDLTEIRVIDQRMIELVYLYGDHPINLRITPGISCPFSDEERIYSREKEMRIGKVTVTLFGNDNRYMAAAWCDAKRAYALEFETGVDETTLALILNFVR